MITRASSLCAMVFVLANAGRAQLTRRVSVASNGAPANFGAVDGSISASGRYVAFESRATNLAAGDAGVDEDVFVHDRDAATTEWVSVGPAGAEGNGKSYGGSISADARYVTFWSSSSNLVPGDTNLYADVFVRDRVSGTTTRISVAPNGAEANHSSNDAAISADGRWVAFRSQATNLVPGDTSHGADVFVRDLWNGVTTRVSVATGGAESNVHSYFQGSISADGRYVAFHTQASNLVPGDTNGKIDTFVHDRRTGETTRASLSHLGQEGNADAWGGWVSNDGRHVGFQSQASNLVAGDTNGTSDAFVRDTWDGTTVRVSLGPGGVQADLASWDPRLSSDGRFAVFRSRASNLVPGDTNWHNDVFVRDLWAETTSLVTVAFDGGPVNDDSSLHPTISADGRFVAFQTLATNILPDSDGAAHVYVRDLRASGFVSECDPGIGGVIDCPCANPPAGRGRGCDNASATGGAVLSASGVAYLASDALVFTTSGENPAATSILLQGNASIPAGLVFGLGARCAGGTMLRRLFTSVAVGGSITVPDLGGGDPTVSERSAEKGDVIQAGESRWYLVYYRDAAVSGGCSPASTFNTTQTGRVDWSL